MTARPAPSLVKQLFLSARKEQDPLAFLERLTDGTNVVIAAASQEARRQMEQHLADQAHQAEIREVLQGAFPTTKFRLHHKNNSYRLCWTKGPAPGEVQETLDQANMWNTPGGISQMDWSRSGITL